ncbi:MAG: serpin family protein [bacterium]
MVLLPAAALAQGTPPAGPLAPPQLAESVNEFGFQLLRTLQRAPAPAGSGPQNLFLSPPSVAWAFDMVLNGAGGATTAALAKTLQVPGWGLPELNAASLALRRSLEAADPKVTIKVANSLWGKTGLEFFPDFLAAARNFYSAELAPLTTVEPINAWVSAATQGKIPSILNPENITPQTILVLVNALYFKGLWQRPFDPSRTAPQAFHPQAGAERPVPMMSQSGSYAYFEDSQVQAIRLPYGGGRLALVVVLPAANSSLKAFLDALDAARWRALVSGLKNRPGQILLPRFKVEYGAELSEPLKAMGMEVAFTEAADFKKLAKVPPGWWVKISSVRHKVFVEVNEEGTEAAAATAISMLAGAAPPPQQPPFRMVVDRPFFAALQDSQSGLLLFIGGVAAP